MINPPYSITVVRDYPNPALSPKSRGNWGTGLLRMLVLVPARPHSIEVIFLSLWEDKLLKSVT